MAAVAGVPLAATGAVLNEYAAPKIAVLVVCSAAVAGLLLYLALAERRSPIPRTRLAITMAVYAAALAAVTAFSVDPMISLEGSIASHMGLVAWLCFVACAFGTLAAAGADRPFFLRLAFVVVATGGVVAAVGVAQFLYKVATDWPAVVAGDESVRVHSSIGHPDYAGNFLLYPALLAVGLARAAPDRARRVACRATAVLAAVAIVYTGTRGAWLGYAAGLALALALLRRSAAREARPAGAARRAVAIAAVAVVLGAGVVAFTDLGNSVRNRASKFYTEGFTGAGRTVIWGLTLRMVPAYWAAGCGFETFRLAQLPFKTPEFERAMNGTTAEDPHNAYLSHLVSTGVVATGLFLLLLGLAVADLGAAIRASASRADAAVGIGLVSALVAALVHGVFLHHMLADGLYLFVFVGLAGAWRAVVSGAVPAPSEPARRPARAARVALAAACGLPLAASVVYAWRVLAADRDMLLCISAARSGNDDLTRRYGGRAAAAGFYQTDYHLLYSAALEQLVERQPRIDAAQRLEMAAAEVDLARERTITPVNGLVSAALLKIRLGRYDEAADDLGRAGRTDPVSGLPELGWASYFLNRGDTAQAVAHYVEARRRGVLFSRAETLDARLWAAVATAGDDHRALRRMLSSVDGTPAPDRTNHR